MSTMLCTQRSAHTTESSLSPQLNFPSRAKTYVQFCSAVLDQQHEDECLVATTIHLCLMSCCTHIQDGILAFTEH